MKIRKRKRLKLERREDPNAIWFLYFRNKKKKKNSEPPRLGLWLDKTRIHISN